MSKFLSMDMNTSLVQTTLFDTKMGKDIEHINDDKYSGTFSKNMSTQVHGWYRYSAGFSFDWVNRFICQEKRMGEAIF
ncbi:hypothetical protein [Methanocella conradii]|uniref:hypothetical protein n=1 Tax=Methanocella conradii TaxID=1175444 RepID=UPI00157DB0A5|nr:hypothetical protein [Methanocella conradii]